MKLARLAPIASIRSLRFVRFAASARFAAAFASVAAPVLVGASGFSCKTAADAAADDTTPGQSGCFDGGAAPCGPTTCTNDAECGGGICSGEGRCIAEGAADGRKNGDESDIDCGGSQSAKCVDGKACTSDTSCATGWCKGGVCTTPRGDDGVKNGDESDVDCGGTKTGAPACAVGRACERVEDCASSACSYKKLCVDRPSCVVREGGDTCGPGELDDPKNQHESCCRSIDLPMAKKTVALDKYQVTAGRFRVFLDAVGGDVRAFVRQHRPAGWDPTWDELVPNGWDVDPTLDDANDPSFLRRAHSSVWHQLGGTALLYKLGRDGLPFKYGCAITGNGTHTYRMPDDVQTNVLGDIPHKYAQEVLDVKALNCVTPIMLAAFCEWDWPGSRLPTYEEIEYAWSAGAPGSHKFPWGNAPAPVGFKYPGDVNATGVPEPTGRFGPDAVVPDSSAGMRGELEYANWKYSYNFPSIPWPSAMYPDFSAHISAPGRFPKGNGPFGHSDVAGNLFDFTSTISGSAGMHPDSREVTWGRNGAWEGHNIPFKTPSDPWTAPLLRKYGKAGGRCAKPK